MDFQLLSIYGQGAPGIPGAPVHPVRPGCVCSGIPGTNSSWLLFI